MDQRDEDRDVSACVCVCICTGDNIPADSVSLFRLIYPHLSSFPSRCVTIATTSLLSSITDPFVPSCLSSLLVLQ